MRLFGSFAVFLLVNFFFIPFIRAQKESLRGPPSGCGAFNPGLPGFARLYEARPLAFKPPLGFLPSLRCHAGDLAIEHRCSHVGRGRNANPDFGEDTFARNHYVEVTRRRSSYE